MARVLFVQPFSIGGPSGGARILRTLVERAPDDVKCLSVCTWPTARATALDLHETHLPARPSFGRLEYTRVGVAATGLELPLGPLLFSRLKRLAGELGITHVHAVADVFDSWPAYRVARSLGVPYLLSAHDDQRYKLGGRLGARRASHHLMEAWQAADARFVISEALGEEYVHRYGDRDYEVVTDGTRYPLADPISISPKSANVYFMGSLYRSLTENFSVLLNALEILGHEHPERSVSLTSRGSRPPGVEPSPVLFHHLPYAEREEEVWRDVRERADLLYLPLPFGRAHADFVRSSMSTRAITYLGGGKPIVYHGPRDAYLAELLASSGAAVIAATTNPRDLAHAVGEALERAPELTANALRLARERFDPDRLAKRFWDRALRAQT